MSKCKRPILCPYQLILIPVKVIHGKLHGNRLFDLVKIFYHTINEIEDDNPNGCH